jgi:hypothetical protein
MLGIDALPFGFNLPEEPLRAPNDYFHLDSIPKGLPAWSLLLREVARFEPGEFRPAPWFRQLVYRTGPFPGPTNELNEHRLNPAECGHPSSRQADHNKR